MSQLDFSSFFLVVKAGGSKIFNIRPIVATGSGLKKNNIYFVYWTFNIYNFAHSCIHEDNNAERIEVI